MREGSKRPNVWAIEHYDWAEPGRVSWIVEESNFCKPIVYHAEGDKISELWIIPEDADKEAAVLG